MKKDNNIQSLFFLQVLVYGTCFLLFVGLLITVGMNMFLSEIFLSSFTQSSYMHTFSQLNGTLFWSVSTLLFFFTAFCSTFFRWVEGTSLREKPVTKMILFTKFLHAFVSEWGFVIVLVVIMWVSGKFILTHLSRTITASYGIPLYDNRAEYDPKPDRIKFSPDTALRES